jgi:hypothetical protein
LVGVVAISLGVLAMHQLAVNHSFAAPATGHSHIHPDEVVGAMVHNSLTDVLAVEHSHSPLTVGSGHANPCWPGCGADHEMGVGSCLLALTLMMLSWLLAASRECRQVLSMTFRPTVGLVHVTIRRVSLSLTELSVSRT